MHKRALSFLSWGKWGGKLTFIWMRVEWLILRMCIPRAYFLEVHYPTWVWRKHWNRTEPERQQIEQESLGPVVLQEGFTPSLMGSNKSSSFVPPLLALYLITSGSQVLGIHPGTAPPPCVIWDFLQHSCALIMSKFGFSAVLPRRGMWQAAHGLGDGVCSTQTWEKRGDCMNLRH